MGMTKVLITGGRGFIGQNLTEELVGSGYHVASVDWRDSEANDLRQPNVFQHHLDVQKPDVVIHLAAQVGRLQGEDDLVFTVQENAQMTTLVANACSLSGAKLMFASTSEIYGDWGDDPVFEDMAYKSKPINLYGLTKWWGEQVCDMYWDMNGRRPEELFHLRLSMPYGTGVEPGRGRAALPNMLWQAQNSLPIPVHRFSGRSWCWVGDTVRGMRMILESGLGGAWNVGRSDNFTSMRDIAEMSCDMAGASWDLIEEVDPPGPQVLVKKLRMDKLLSLGWTPTVSLTDGMQEIYNWVSQFDAEGNKALAQLGE